MNDREEHEVEEEEREKEKEKGRKRKERRSNFRSAKGSVLMCRIKGTVQNGICPLPCESKSAYARCTLVELDRATCKGRRGAKKKDKKKELEELRSRIR